MPTKKKKQQTDKTSLLLAIVASLALVIIGVMAVMLNKQANTLGMYELIENIDNQACRYLDNQPAVNGRFDLTMDAPAGEPRLVYECYTGELNKSRDIHGKSIGQYEKGASVAYFATNQEALTFAEQQLNPLRYWGVDEAGQQANIPQTSKFTFIVTDEKVPYFDAYTVKANAVLRISLPCDNTEDIKACQTQAEAMLDRELIGINVTD